MKSDRILTSLFISVSFWMAIVLLLLSFHGEINNKAIATPIATDIQKQIDAPISNSGPEEITLSPQEPTLPPYQEISGELSRGETLDHALKRLDITAPARAAIIKGFAKSLDFKELQPGDSFIIQSDHDNVIIRAIYTSGQLNTYILDRNDDGSYLASRQAVPLEYRIERISGIIESSLYTAFSDLGEAPKLIYAYADIFSSKIDFNTETHAGDRFELLVEKYYKDDVFVGYGKILAARYQQKDVFFDGYYFSTENTPSGYFDGNGEALGTWFIRSPIPFGRVTSKFTMRRKHPIYGDIRPHLGVDLAAPIGTPVMAAANGKVMFIGRRGGFGNTIILRHNGGYKTYYGHLNGFKKGLKAGSFVSQKEIIGYVGSTGIATGPHLDYRIQHNGIFKNPFGIKFKAKTVLQNEELELFRKKQDHLAELFNANTDEKILQVKNVILSDDNRISFL
ncbi:MAG: M23 family metallopeptidase [Desulfobulbales bacterium]